ncbi:sulfatase-like hydrolase/transferase, partial [bacterium]|nr:sulfatase-like hydrolase/transferase [bacterium]
YYGLPFSNDMGRQAGREHQFPPLPLLRDEQVIQEQPDQASLTERYVEEAVRFMRHHRGQPFFLYFAHMYVHLPLYAPARFLRESPNGAYGAAVACIDWATGVLLHELQALGLDQDTLVVFTSDNGARGTHGGSNAPLRGGKGTTWEGGMRLPCLMRWPGHIPAGTSSPVLVTSLEFLPTLAALAGAHAPNDRIIDGRDISGLLREPATAPPPREEFFYYWQNQLDAVRAGPWKLHVRKTDQEIRELYDLTTDPGETTNVYDQQADVVRDLESRLQRCREDLGDTARGIAGANCRPIGRVDSPAPLTHYDPAHPYIIGMYDLTDAG